MLVDWFWFSLVLSFLLLWLLWHWPQLWPHLQTTTVAAAQTGPGAARHERNALTVTYLHHRLNLLCRGWQEYRGRHSAKVG